MDSFNFIKEHYYTNALLREILSKQSRSGHLCHAYMFFGPKGSGKLTLARYFAAAILCRNKNKPCFECESCKKIMHGNHPDYYEYSGSGGHDSVHIEEIREIRTDAYIVPNDGIYKVYVMPNVENMTQSAANAFLKVLEEPPSHAVFILTSDSRESVLDTIKSRSIMFETFPLSDDQLYKSLKTEYPDLSEDMLTSAIASSNGLIGTAIGIIGSSGDSKIADAALKAAELIAEKKEYEFLLLTTKAVSTRENATEFLSCLYNIVRHAMVIKLNEKKEADTAAKLAAVLSIKKIYNLCNAIEYLKFAITSNVNLTLLADYLTSALFKIAA